MMHLDTDGVRKLNVVFKASGIETRHSVLTDYASRNGFIFYSNTPDLSPFPTTKKRSLAFQQHALPLSKEAACRALEQRRVDPHRITHLITVSCTGMYAPG